MGGRGSSSMSSQSNFDARGDKKWFANLRDALMREAEATKDGFQSALAKDDRATCEAGAALVGTERGFALVNDDALKNLKRVMDDTYGRDSMRTLGNLQRMLAPGTNERPMYMELDEWADAKRSAQTEFEKLSAKGYTEAEAAAAVRFYTHLRKRSSNSTEIPKKSSGNTVTSYKTGKPEQVPRFSKGFGGSKTANTYTTKQFVPYAGIVVPASAMTHTSGGLNTNVYKIADIHKGIHGAWLEGQNTGGGFAVNVFKDNKGWYMQHSRLGHTDSDGNWTDRVYLEKLRKRVGF